MIGTNVVALGVTDSTGWVQYGDSDIFQERIASQCIEYKLDRRKGGVKQTGKTQHYDL